MRPKAKAPEAVDFRAPETCCRFRQHEATWGCLKLRGQWDPRNIDRLEILGVLPREYVEVSEKYPHRAYTRGVSSVRVPPSVSLYKSCFGDLGRN